MTSEDAEKSVTVAIMKLMKMNMLWKILNVRENSFWVDLNLHVIGRDLKTTKTTTSTTLEKMMMFSELVWMTR